MPEDTAKPAPSHMTARLTGHREAEARFLRAYASKKLHHAWLLSGPRGIGKATLAYRMARFLLRDDKESGLFGLPDTLDMEPDHPVFRKVAQGSHPDILVLEQAIDPKTGLPAREISVDEARKVAGFLHLTPAEAEYRVVVVDSVDAMNRNAANALLKLLEEPPARAVLLLVSHQPARLLPTIRSRCQQVKCAPLTVIEQETVLAQHAPDMPIATQRALLQFAAGSPGVALECYRYQTLSLYETIIERLTPTTPIEDIFALAEQLAAKQTPHIWQHAHLAIGFLFHRLVQASLGTMGQAIVKGETQTVERMLAQKPIQQWLAVWPEIQAIFTDTERAHLDKKLATLSLQKSLTG